jgi:hemoglobin-like flavoprotein
VAGGARMSLDTESLRQSFLLVFERRPTFTGRFYEILFERHPCARRLFSASMTKQEEMLTETLVAVLDRIEDGVWLAATLRALGERHVAYGVTDEMYSWVGEALLAVLAEIAGPDWTPRMERAWLDAYRALAGWMLEGAHPPSTG